MDGSPATGRIDDELLDTRVSGVNLMPGTLRDQLGKDVSLLIFLRHFGCVFCRESVAELREASRTEGFPPVLFFYQGSAREGRAFMRGHWPEARAVADPERRFYASFGVERGRLLQLFGPGVFSAGRRAKAQGFENGPRTGDIFMMPGAFLVRGDRILWRHEFRHAGDHPDFAAIPARLAAL